MQTCSPGAPCTSCRVHTWRILGACTPAGRQPASVPDQDCPRAPQGRPSAPKKHHSCQAPLHPCKQLILALRCVGSTWPRCAEEIGRGRSQGRPKCCWDMCPGACTAEGIGFDALRYIPATLGISGECPWGSCLNTCPSWACRAGGAAAQSLHARHSFGSAAHSALW